MADESATIELSRSELRAVTGYAVACARPALTQVRHILGSAAHAARALELAAGDDPAIGLDQIARFRTRAPTVVVDVLRRYPSAPAGSRRVGELMRLLDASLR